MYLIYGMEVLQSTKRAHFIASQRQHHSISTLFRDSNHSGNLCQLATDETSDPYYGSLYSSECGMGFGERLYSLPLSLKARIEYL